MEPGSTFSVMATPGILPRSSGCDSVVVIVVIRARRRIYTVDANCAVDSQESELHCTPSQSGPRFGMRKAPNNRMHAPSHFVEHTMPVPDTRACNLQSKMRTKWLMGPSTNALEGSLSGVVLPHERCSRRFLDAIEGSGEKTA